MAMVDSPYQDRKADVSPNPAIAHRMLRLRPESVRLVADQGDNHAVEVEEEHQEVEAQLEERFLQLPAVRYSLHRARSDGAVTHLLVHVQLAEDLGRVQQMLVIVDPSAG
jgi:hypothetical protein